MKNKKRKNTTMKRKITVNLSPEQAGLIDELVSQFRDPFTNKPVSIQEVFDTLAEDLALACRRPGSWEGANMLQIIASHGFLNEHIKDN